MPWQRPLAVDVEQALRLQRGLQPQESLVQIAQACPADGFNAQLQFAARFIQRDQRANLHGLAFARGEIGVLVAALEHHAADLRGCIFEREIPMAAGRAREVRDLAAHPAQRKVAFKQPRNAAIDIADGEHLLPAPVRC